MNERDIKKLIDLAKEKLRKGVSKEEAQTSLFNAGILDKKGNFTKHYRSLSLINSE